MDDRSVAAGDAPVNALGRLSIRSLMFLLVLVVLLAAGVATLATAMR